MRRALETDSARGKCYFSWTDSRLKLSDLAGAISWLSGECRSVDRLSEGLPVAAEQPERIAVTRR